jgi:hypothetical protein
MKTTAIVNSPTAANSTQPLGALVSDTGTTRPAIGVEAGVGCGRVVGTTVRDGVEISDGTSAGAGRARPSVRCGFVAAVLPVGVPPAVAGGWWGADGGVDDPGADGVLDPPPGAVGGGECGGGADEDCPPPSSCPRPCVVSPTRPVTPEIVPLTSDVSPPSKPPSSPWFCGVGVDWNAVSFACP